MKFIEIQTNLTPICELIQIQNIKELYDLLVDKASHYDIIIIITYTCNPFVIQKFAELTDILIVISHSKVSHKIDNAEIKIYEGVMTHFKGLYAYSKSKSRYHHDKPSNSVEIVAHGSWNFNERWELSSNNLIEGGMARLDYASGYGSGFGGTIPYRTDDAFFAPFSNIISALTEKCMLCGERLEEFGPYFSENGSVCCIKCKNVEENETCD